MSLKKGGHENPGKAFIDTPLIKQPHKKSGDGLGNK